MNPRNLGGNGRTTPSYTEGNCDFTHNICTETQLVDCKNTQVEDCPAYTLDYDCKDPNKTKTWCESVVICKETEKNCVDSKSKAPICCPASDQNCNYSIKCDSIEYCLISKDIECTVNLAECEVEVTTRIDHDCDTI